MTSRSVLIAAVVILTVFIAALSIWTLSPNPPPPTPTAPSPTPAKNGTATLGELVLCKDFQKVENEITCEDALSIAKAKYSGRIKSIAPGRALQKDSSNSKVVEMWRIDILLGSPLKKDQEIFEGARIFIDRKTGSEIRSVYLHKL